MAKTITTVETFDNVALNKLAFKFKGEENSIIADCVGGLSGETEMQEIVKKCGATEVAKISKPIKLTLTITANVPMAVYRDFYGMRHNEATKPGVYSYGPSSKGKMFSLSAEVVDEFTDNSRLLAFLNCASTTGLTFSIENGADEIAALELEASANLDELGEFYHEAIVQEMEEDITDLWINNLSADVIKLTESSAKK